MPKSIRVVPVAIVAAVTALLVSGLFPNGEADARRRPPPDPCQNHRNTREMRRLQGEVAQLQADLAAYQSAYSALDDGMNRLERLAIRRVRDRRAKNALVGAINRAREAASQNFAAAVPTAPATPVPPPPPAPQPVYDQPAPQPIYQQPSPQPMTRRDFRGLRHRVEKVSFSDDRLTLVRSAAAANLFTVDQVIELMNVCDFEKTKLEIAELLYDRVIDIDQWHRVYGALEFEASRDRLRRRTERRHR